MCNLCCIDVIYRDVVLGEIALYLVRYEVHKLFTVEDCIQQECAILLQTTGNVIHVEICLNVACYEVRCVHQISRTNGGVTKAQV